MVVKMIQDFRNRSSMDPQDKRKADLEELNNKQTEMSKTITEMKNILEGINSRITEAEKWISDQEDNGGNLCCRTE